MNMLRVITSSSQQRLVQAFADRLLQAPAPPLAREAVVVLSNGMSRWLSMELARRHGVAAGIEYHFPNDLLDRCFRALFPDLPAGSAFTPQAMAWRIARELPRLAGAPGFGPAAAYLGDRDDRRLLQFSRILADTFDQYTIFRPELLSAWDAGQGDDWQAHLWRAISSGCTGQHRAALLQRFARTLPGCGTRPAGIPPRISLIGISYLPPFHLRALALLSGVSEVSCYLLNPCGQYWGGLISERALARRALRDGAGSPALAHYETGNPLLSSLGTLGQEFFETLLDAGFDCEMLDDAAPAAAPPGTLLACIQDDILALRDRRTEPPAATAAAPDRSLTIHSCHGPLREMEVLYDQILAMFDEMPDLEPRQVVVMIPDIEAYVPYITAVFGGRSGGRPGLPFSIADRSTRRESPYAAAFLKLLDLPGSRFGINEVLALLELPPVLARFGLDAADAAAVRERLVACNVRWGLDGDQRSSLGFPAYDDFSWQQGLDRLLLGYALDDDQQDFKGIAPCPVGGGEAEVIGRIADFLAVCRRLNRELSRSRPPYEWAELLARATAELLMPTDQDERGAAAVAQAIDTLRTAQLGHGYTAPLDPSAVKELLARELGQGGSGYGFMSGGITFCAMLPMRSIPMRAICLAGMNDGVFPRTSRPPGFSHMSGTRRRGDRSLRDEDRYLFLEALLSARERLCITYTGQDERDNGSRPPSVLVAELCDYVQQGFALPDILLRHRLQGFSRAYFAEDGDRLFSYAAETCAALRRAGAAPTVRDDAGPPLPPLADEVDRVELRDLRAFLNGAAAYFLARRLGVHPVPPDEEATEYEPFAAEGLSDYQLRQELLTHQLRGGDAASAHAWARSRGLTPPLSTGDAAFAAAWERSGAIARRILPHLTEELDDLVFEIPLGYARLVGSLDRVRRGRHLLWRAGNLGGRDRLNLWLDHLVLNALEGDHPRSSLMVAQDSCLELPPVETARTILDDLLRLYAEGLTRPLPFFPRTSWSFLADGIAAAHKSWEGDGFSGMPGEAARPAHRICFGQRSPLDEEFRTLAHRVFAPLQAAASEEALP